MAAASAIALVEVAAFAGRKLNNILQISIDVEAKPLLQNSYVKVQHDNLPFYTLEEVLEHDTEDDCWTIINDFIYDITRFIQKHPGGKDVLLEYAGRDSTIAFRAVGHNKQTEFLLKPYLIGILPENQRLWTNLALTSQKKY